MGTSDFDFSGIASVAAVIGRVGGVRVTVAIQPELVPSVGAV